MSRINPNLFEEIFCRNFDNVRYTAYRPIGHPIILFSLIDGSPLAALTLRTQTGNSGQSIIVKKPEKELPEIPYDFQGIIDKNNQEFEFVITNFCDCLINFNILREDNKVNEVNPGACMSLNKVNELNPGQSYAIKCDQKNNLTFVLKKIEDGDKNISLGEENINVTDLKNKPEEIKNFSPRGSYYYLSVVPQKTDTETIKKFKKTKWECVDFFIRKEKISNIIDEGYENLPEDEVDFCNTSTDSVVLANSSEIVPINSIVDSSIANVIGGKRIIEYSEETDVDYDYDSNSVKCLLTLTVNENLILIPKNETLIDESKEFISKIIKNKSSLLLNDLSEIYSSDTCCICFDVKPNIIFYQCGHQCAHDNCSKKLTKCPLCRKLIAAKLTC